MIWVVVASVAAVCFALRATVPVLLAGRGLPPWLARRLNAAVPALLAAMIAVQLLTAHGRFAVDARAAGVGAAAAAYAWRRSLVVAFATAAAVTAGLRLL